MTMLSVWKLLWRRLVEAIGHHMVPRRVIQSGHCVSHCGFSGADLRRIRMPVAKDVRPVVVGEHDSSKGEEIAEI